MQRTIEVALGVAAGIVLAVFILAWLVTVL